MGRKINHRILIPLILVVSLILAACSRDGLLVVNAPEQPGVKAGQSADPASGMNEPEGAGAPEQGSETGKGAKPDAEAEPESMTNPETGPEQLRPTLQDYVINSGISGAFSQFQRSGEMWAKLWLSYTYPDREFTEVKARTVSSGISNGLSDYFAIQPIICRLDFKSSEPVPGATRLDGGDYELDIMAVAITVFENDGRMILSGFLGPGEFDPSDVFPEAYRVVEDDSRFGGMLNPYPQSKLPEEFTAFDLRQVTGGRNSSEEHILPGGILAALVRSENDEISVALYDLIHDKPLGQKKLGAFYGESSKVENGKLVLTILNNQGRPGEIITVDSSLNVTREPYTEAKAFRQVSPDGTRYVYSQGGSLYLADVQGSVPPRLLLEGNAFENLDRNFYYPFGWASNTLIVYGIGGYEWSNGTGVYDLAAGQNTFLKQAGAHGSPGAIHDGQLYTLSGEMGAPYDPYIIDLTNPEFPARQVFADPDFQQEIESAGSALSPDGSKIALLVRPDPDREKFVLYLCSTADGSVLKEFKFETVFNSAQYLEFIEDDQLAVLSQEYTMSPEYLYLVQLD